LDLAWSARNPSGLARAVLQGGLVRIRETAYPTTDREIVNLIRAWCPGPALLAIDAPIIAPNPPGTMREADREMTRLFGRYHAGVYPANRLRCARPIGLRRKLARLGFSPDPVLPPQGSFIRRQIEMFPHSSAVALFGLKRIIKYKKGSVAQRRRGLVELQRTLGRLEGFRPPLAREATLESLVRRSPRRLEGRALKRLEDELDGIFLAYLAASYWTWGLERYAVVGTLERGYIVTARAVHSSASTKNQLDTIKLQL
jgi:predicted RNase H-like nuclease